MTDRYSKIMLTLIGVALIAIAAQNATRPARAQEEQFSCGDKSDPCYVRADRPLEVQVWPTP